MNTSRNIACNMISLVFTFNILSGGRMMEYRRSRRDGKITERAGKVARAEWSGKVPEYLTFDIYLPGFARNGIATVYGADGEVVRVCKMGTAIAFVECEIAGKDTRGEQQDPEEAELLALLRRCGEERIALRLR